MRKLIALLFLISVLALAACGTENADQDETEKDAVAEEEPTNEETSDTSDENTEESTKEEEPEEAEESSESGNLIGSDAKKIFQKSAEAMQEVSSYLVKGEFTDDSTINGQSEKATTELTMELSLADQSNMYMKASTTSNTNSGGVVELYKVTDGMYVNSPDQDQWMKMPASSDYGNLFTTLQADQLTEYVNFSNAFEVTDNGNQFILTFTGTDEEYKTTVLGAGIAAQEGILKEHYDNMNVSGTYEIKIDKDSFYMVGYTLEYESTTSGEIGEVETYHNAKYTISEFNEHDNITVPKEIADSAVSFSQ
ncbi:DUF6612 family protein [Virgibacillus salinus]|uniref:Lipoprotein n=1 Tax=Virgibacillus salinus TaxID=553311 RepID=A0A1H0Z4E1_9BACI|nr:DUF6612 family protein [Virgibacillus salinus]SDQ21991.1 hypothetical protein SAMN05216231_1005 [Virgibacillus salinus]